MIDRSKIGSAARDAGIKAALAARGSADDDDGDGEEDCECPKCGHTGPREDFMASETGVDDGDVANDANDDEEEE